MAHFEFCNQDITLDVLMKIEQVVRILAINNNIPFDNMLGKFYSSKTYKNLKHTVRSLG